MKTDRVNICITININIMQTSIIHNTCIIILLLLLLLRSTTVIAIVIVIVIVIEIVVVIVIEIVKADRTQPAPTRGWRPAP